LVRIRWNNLARRQGTVFRQEQRFVNTDDAGDGGLSLPEFSTWDYSKTTAKALYLGLQQDHSESTCVFGSAAEPQECFRFDHHSQSSRHSHGIFELLSRT
jgi:hypothetical protein